MDDTERSRLFALFAAKTEASRDGCLIWHGATSRGYGAIRSRGKVYYAHRIAWEMENGPIPEGAHIDHVCHTPACVNPGHLRAATPSQNISNRSGAQSNSASGIRGVFWDKSRERWVAHVRSNGKDVLRRRFDRLEDAALAAATARTEAFGEYAGNN